MGLARVGSRAALSFAFAFLRRAWRSGEDADLCSELLQESLDALRYGILLAVPLGNVPVDRVATAKENRDLGYYFPSNDSYIYHCNMCVHHTNYV